MMKSPCFAGFDFGTESVRAVIVDARGRTVGSATAAYPHGQIIQGSDSASRFFNRPLPPSFALQHPLDWLDAAGTASRAAMQAGSVDAHRITGIGVDFTSCTMLPCRADGTPMCINRMDGQISPSPDPHAWPKLWKHHGASTQADRMNAVATSRAEPWLSRYGGIIGLEWLFPKMLEVIESSPRTADQTEIWLEAGDWMVWQMLGSPALGGSCFAESLPRSTCQAGYKALWSAESGGSGYPSQEYFGAVHPGLAHAASKKLPGRFVAPGRCAGSLGAAMARRLGMCDGTAVSAAIIDAHSGVPGAGVGTAGTLVMVLGTSGCHMLLADDLREIAGVAGVVRDGILPGFWGYETGQPAMGDAFDFVRRLAGHSDFRSLDAQAAAIPAGASGLLCLDWFNGCRTPLMDASLSAAIMGLGLHHTAVDVYRAVLEASAFGLRWIVDALRAGGLRVEGFVATGGLSHKNPLFMQIIASVLNEPVSIHQAKHGPALGAAILGALAAGSANGGFDDIAEAVASMAGARSALPQPTIINPQQNATRTYQQTYRLYREAAEELARGGSILRRVHDQNPIE